MPTYEYACSTCDTNHEVVQPITEDTLTVCPVCSEPGLRKLFSNVGVVFKGSGFYRTDSREKKSDSISSNSKSSDTKSSESTSGDSKSGDSKSGDAKPSESKPSESKPSESKPSEPAKKAESKAPASSGSKSSAPVTD
ncbi:MAG: FmdB family transcriptional regulator [Actinobacteria bacterium]|nr:MAG: FmdB family transcriptional regulator [Actinomycetota bacterium]